MKTYDRVKFLDKTTEKKFCKILLITGRNLLPAKPVDLAGLSDPLTTYCCRFSRTRCRCRQVCSAGSKLLVQEPVFDRFISKLKARMGRLRVGDSMDKCVDMGAIVEPAQRHTIDRYVQIARDEGAQVTAFSPTVQRDI